jgi:hypothetical protein
LQQWVHVTLTRRIASNGQPGPGSPFAAIFLHWPLVYFGMTACGSIMQFDIVFYDDMV